MCQPRTGEATNYSDISWKSTTTYHALETPRSLQLPTERPWTNANQAQVAWLSLQRKPNRKLAICKPKSRVNSISWASLHDDRQLQQRDLLTSQKYAATSRIGSTKEWASHSEQSACARLTDWPNRALAQGASNSKRSRPASKKSVEVTLTSFLVALQWLAGYSLRCKHGTQSWSRNAWSELSSQPTPNLAAFADFEQGKQCLKQSKLVQAL